MQRILFALWIMIAAGMVAAPAGPAHSEEDDASGAEKITLKIGHRLHPQFGEMITVNMNEMIPIGDTDLYFEIVEFFPQFAYMDSSKTFVSLSDEPKNPAFRIKVYEGEEFVEQTWAFYSVKVPHFSPKAMLVFDVTGFEYRNVQYGAEEKTPSGEKAGDES